MIKKSSKIPTFKNIAETADWWDTHDSTEFLDELSPAHLTFPKPKHLLITLKPQLMNRLRHLADKMGKPSDQLVQQWIAEKLTQIAFN